MTSPVETASRGLSKVTRATSGTHGSKLSDQVREQLLRILRSGRFPEGAKLPPEREFAELLGVSRTVLREALAALQLSGLLVRHPGVGTVVARLPSEPESDDLTKHLEAGASIAELIDARLAVELGCVHLICDKADRNLDEAGALLDVMRIEALSRRSTEGYVPPSLDFHIALARAAEAPVLSAYVEDLIARTRPHLWLLLEHYTLETLEKSLAVHEAMLAALRGGDLIAALAATKRHYIEYPVLSSSSSRIKAPSS
jgi:GntR family transcriptional regulator, transcriptional repressor for pyruvate dehydrogenase complex